VLEHPKRGPALVGRLQANAVSLRYRLRRAGFQVLGDDPSPVVPIFVVKPAALLALSREALAARVAIVVVGYPATDLFGARARLCVSAAHTDDDLERAVAVLTRIGARHRLLLGGLR